MELVRLVAGRVDRERLGGVPPQDGSTYESTHKAETGEDQSVAAAKPDDKYTPIHVGGSHGNFPRFTASTNVAWSRSV
jgi:hypothetical protein